MDAGLRQSAWKEAEVQGRGEAQSAREVQRARISRRARRLLIVICAVVFPGVVFGQFDDIDPYFLQNFRRQRGNSIAFCINPHSILVDFERAVATEIASALLLTPTFHEIEHPFRGRVDYDIPLNEPDQFIVMNNYCDAMLGYPVPITSAAVSDWMSLTRPYFSARFVFVTREEAGYSRLGDIPAGSPIATRILSRGDTMFLTYLRNVPEATRWMRVPLVDDFMVVDMVRAGEAEAGLIWEPARSHLEQASDMKTVAPSPAPEFQISFALLVKAQDTFIRSMLDEAIGALIADGVIEELLEEHDVPGLAPRL